MRRDRFLISAGAAAIAATPVLAAADAASKLKLNLFLDPLNGKLGGEIVAPAEFKGILEALDPTLLEGTALQVMNPAPSNAARVILGNLPAISQQGTPGSIGSPGSCEAQSFGYCLGSYTAARNPNGSVKWDASEPRNEASPAWLYQWSHTSTGKPNGCPSGSGCISYANKLVTTGAPSVAEDPYNPHDATTVHGICSYIESLDVSSPGPSASRFIIGSYKGFSNIKNNKATYLSAFKSLIRQGHAIAFSGLVAKQYCVESPPLSNDAFTAPAGFIPKSGHGQCIVGFDDSKGPRGAFLVQNSFGTAWNPGAVSDHGHNGRIWWDYDAFFASQGFALIMYPNTSESLTGTKLHANVSGTPVLAVRSAHRRTDSRGRHFLVFVLQSSGPLNVSQVHATGPKGKTFNGTLNETMRFGYVYIRNTGSKPFKPGTYKFTVNATTMAKTPVTYTTVIAV